MPHSEIRTDPIHDRFVIIAPKRGKRPHDVLPAEVPVSSRECPFCQDPLMHTKGIYTVRDHAKPWCIKVVKNKFPVVSPTNPRAYGTQEVVVETPEHNVEIGELPDEHVVKIFETYIARTEALSRDKKIKYILIFKNHGGKAGASLVHAHSQIFATGFLPPHIIDKLTKGQEYRIAHGICYYDELIKKEEKGPRRIFSDAHMVTFTPWASIYNYEAWIMPRRHLDNITQLTHEELHSLALCTKRIIKKINAFQISYNYYLHQAITDKEEHFYLRIAPRRDIWAGIELGSRLIINTVSPETAARYYRS
ncbi:MAG: DUF4931 domain-containing protein [Patescibacteria group bacterium]